VTSTPYDLDPIGMVRLLANDTTDAEDTLFSDDEIAAFLQMEAGVVKRAAAQAIDTIADNEALLSKAIRTQDLETDGPKVADALRKRAAALRAQADTEEAKADDAGFFDIVPLNGPGCAPELAEWPL